jgi:DNA-binding XRE family transcriptional regulator
MSRARLPHTRDVRIRELREALGLTQEDLAHRVGVNRDTIWRWETGQSIPQRRFRVSLARRLGVRVEDLGVDVVHLATSDR